ncbi:alpha/beta fold hydrolase [Candidatus Woesearchaeota archaeon]|nr:alpha/beta fold hydrolase [Candidatus Woesearchaeota archaeon]
MITKRVEFENNKGDVLHGVLRIPDEEGQFPAVIICHTFHDNKDNELIFNLWDVISRAGFAVLRFDFSGRGESQGNFRDLTISQEIDDIDSAFRFMDSSEQIDSDRIGIVGHSMGGIDAVLFSSGSRKVKALVTIAARADTKEFIDSYFDKYQQDEWKRKGYVQMHNLNEISSEFLHDAENHDIIKSIKAIRCPVLIMHGTDDPRVPFQDARELFNHAPEPRQLELIDGADHRITGDSHREQLLDILIDWLVRNLR